MLNKVSSFVNFPDLIKIPTLPSSLGVTQGSCLYFTQLQLFFSIIDIRKKYTYISPKYLSGYRHVCVCVCVVYVCLRERERKTLQLQHKFIFSKVYVL